MQAHTIHSEESRILQVVMIITRMSRC